MDPAGRPAEGVSRSPHLSILFSAILIIAMAVALPIEEVAAAADIMFLLLSARAIQRGWDTLFERKKDE